MDARQVSHPFVAQGLSSSVPVSPHSAISMSKSSEKLSFHEDEVVALAQIDPARKTLERKLILKQDLVIIPFAFLLYVSAYLDRSNLGNARLLGLEEGPLRDDSTKYSIALACFFITYVIFSIPGTLLAKQVNPSTSIAAGAIIWSVAAAGMAGANGPAAVYVCRLFIGLGEAMFGQAMALYFTMWYTRRELSKRIGFFISAGALAGGFGGLIAYAVARMPEPSSDRFRILFLAEGTPTVLLALMIFFFLPSRPSKSKFLTEKERQLATSRLMTSGSYEATNGIEWSGVKRAFTDPKCYIMAVMYSCMNLALGSVGGFLPTIVKDLGYSAAKAQLLTVPPYAVALVFMLLLASFSDYRQTRGIPVAFVFCIGLVGWGILLGVDPVEPSNGELRTRYFGCICVVIAGYAAIPLIMAWVASNSGTESQRAVGLGMLNTIGQCLSILAAFSFPKSERPKYTRGIILNLAFSSLGFCIALGMSFYYRWENRRRDETEDELKDGEMLDVKNHFDLAKGFRYVA